MSRLGEEFRDQSVELALAAQERPDNISILVACCALGEAFAGALLEERIWLSEEQIRTKSLGTPALMGFMLRELERERSSTWKERGRWLRATGLEGVTGTTWYQDFVLLTEIRNAMLHGNGQMTTRQINQIDKFVNLRTQVKRRLGVQVFGTDLQIASADPSKWVVLTQSFIVNLDRRHDAQRLEGATDAAST